MLRVLSLTMRRSSCLSLRNASLTDRQTYLLSFFCASASRRRHLNCANSAPTGVLAGDEADEANASAAAGKPALILYARKNTASRDLSRDNPSRPAGAYQDELKAPHKEAAQRGEAGDLRQRRWAERALSGGASRFDDDPSPISRVKISSNHSFDDREKGKRKAAATVVAATSTNHTTRRWGGRSAHCVEAPHIAPAPAGRASARPIVPLPLRILTAPHIGGTGLAFVPVPTHGTNKGRARCGCPLHLCDRIRRAVEATKTGTA